VIDATTDQHVWAENYDRPAKDIFAVRDDITRRLNQTDLVFSFSLYLFCLPFSRFSRQSSLFPVYPLSHLSFAYLVAPSVKP
jgi:hypothetical protein